MKHSVSPTAVNFFCCNANSSVSLQRRSAMTVTGKDGGNSLSCRCLRCVPADDGHIEKDVVTAFYLRLLNLANSYGYRNNAMLNVHGWHIVYLLYTRCVGFGIAYSVSRAMREPQHLDKQESCSLVFFNMLF